MSLVLLAISLSIMLCVLAFNFAIHALPVMAAIAAFRLVHAGGAGFGLSALAALGGALLSVAFVIAVLGFLRNPFLRLAALGLFATPAAVAGYALAHGVVKTAIGSVLLLDLLCGACGLAVAIAAIVNLSALSEDLVSRQTG